MATAKLPGRLGDPTMAPGSDPRSHPSMHAIIKAYGMDSSSIPVPGTVPTIDSPWDEIYKFTAQADEGMGQMYDSLDYSGVPALAPPTATTRSEQVVTTSDGYEMKLIIHRPSESQGNALPTIVYTHGGGMTLIRTDCVVHMSIMEAFASRGMIAIAIDYRNAYTKAGHNPFPTGLNDCAAGVQWIHAHREQLGVSKLIIMGESGGGNLAIATTLKAKKEGWVDAIDGVAALIPYISGAYGRSDEWKLQHLPSLVECDGYFISSGLCTLLAKVYDPSGDNAENPLAWPYWATEEDLKGLPPHFVSVNELDPLRDEGSVFYRKLAAAGVRVVPRMVLGVVHGGDLLFRQAVPDMFISQVEDIKAFAERV